MDRYLAGDDVFRTCGVVGIGFDSWSLEEGEKRFIDGLGEWLEWMVKGGIEVRGLEIRDENYVG